MVTLIDLWLPILLSAVFVFILSSLIHMLTPLHRGDFGKLPGEGEILGEMRNQGVTPGHYMFPYPDSMKEMGSPEMTKKYEAGPVGHMTVLPNGPPVMTRNLISWFMYILLLGFIVAYISKLALGPGEAYMTVFRTTGAVAILGYAVPYLEQSIWKGQKLSVSLKFLFGGVLYALVTAGTFSWLWPEIG